VSDGNDAAPGVGGAATGVPVDRPMVPSKSRDLVRVVGSRVEGELIRLLPGGFSGAYEELVLRCFPVLRGEGARDPESVVAPSRAVRTRVSTGQTETRGGAHNARRSGLNTRDPLGSERAIRLRARVDRKLRALAREMQAYLDAGNERRDQLRRCTRCRTFADTDWLYCPRDGAPTEQVD
jgi:hypothetical protein